MYNLTVTVHETVFGYETAAWLSDVDDSGRTVLVATEGPTPRSPGEGREDPMQGVLGALQRYASYLQVSSPEISPSGVSEVLR